MNQARLLMRPVRYHTDEHIAGAVIGGLRRRGIDVSTSYDAGLLAATDAEQLLYAHRAGRVLITQDADLLRLNAQRCPHSGIAFFRQGEKTGVMLRMLVLLFDVLSADEMIGRVEFF